MVIEFVNHANKKVKKVVECSARETLDFLGVDSSEIEISVMFASKKAIRELNQRMRSIDKVTDVLSFPNFDLKAGDLPPHEAGESTFLGDMALCLARAKEQAREYHEPYLCEISKLAVHSTLHLLGYDHIKDEDFKKMQPIEDKVKEILLEKKVI